MFPTRLLKSSNSSHEKLEAENILHCCLSIEGEDLSCFIWMSSQRWTQMESGGNRFLSVFSCSQSCAYMYQDASAWCWSKLHVTKQIYSCSLTVHFSVLVILLPSNSLVILLLLLISGSLTLTPALWLLIFITRQLLNKMESFHDNKRHIAQLLDFYWREICSSSDKNKFKTLKQKYLHLVLKSTFFLFFLLVVFNKKKAVQSKCFF